MSTAVESIHSSHGFRAIASLQQAACDQQGRGVWRLSHLLDIHQSGGLVLGAPCSGAPQQDGALQGALVDLIAEVDGYPARRTVVWVVGAQTRNRGIGTALRLHERKLLQREGVDLVYWDVDPLSSVELHLALNKLGGIATTYTHQAREDHNTPPTAEIPTDRLRIEWWLESPRVVRRIDHGQAPPHQSIGLHEMVVLTKTTMLASGARGLLACEPENTSEHQLVEIPKDLSALRSRDPAAAIQWRAQTQAVLEQRFHLGYQGVGLIHEAGRSFIVFTRGTRRTTLGVAKD